MEDKWINLIEGALRAHRGFLAYVKANALLHDADKATPEFLEWSLEGGKTLVRGYPGHNVSYEDRLSILRQKKYFLPFDDMLQVPFPASRVACDPTVLWEEVRIGLLYSFREDPDSIRKLRECAAKIDDKDLKEVVKQLTKKPDEKRPPYLKDSSVRIFEIPELKELMERAQSLMPLWLYDSRPGTSLLDFFLWHHHVPPLEVKTDLNSPTALQVFTAGTAGCDGFDTGYETEAEGLQWAQHHEPDPGNKQFVLATPFGYERIVDVSAAEQTCLQTELDFNAKVRACIDALISGSKDPFAPISNLESVVRSCFDKSIIRTGRPLNDVTLSDHSLSSASLAAAQAARVVLETAGPLDEGYYYALPIRRSKRSADSEWPISEYAIFTCAVNAGRLDDMALELKDIAAIREQVARLLETFTRVFTKYYPVGGVVYQDQYAAHLVIPVLGDPGRRWIQGDASRTAKPWNPLSLPWLAPSCYALTDDVWRQWLFEKTEDVFRKDPDIKFGGELLVGLRYNRIGDELNKLAEAIRWSRSLSHLDAVAAKESADTVIRGFHPKTDDNGDRDSKDIPPVDICPVCRLRFPDRPWDKTIPDLSDRKKCKICRERANRKTDPEETANLELLAKMSEQNRLALISLAFDLDKWLSERSNSGIFSYGKGQTAFPKVSKNQRLNSFGRFRRIWRTTENFLLEAGQAVRNIVSTGEATDPPFPMRTILTAPQDLQVIVPAIYVKPIIDSMVNKFFEAFGRVPGRVPFHISALVFAFRVPIYLVLDAARRLKDMALSPKRHQVILRREDYPNFTWIRDLNGRPFRSMAPIYFRQDHQPKDCPMKGQDQFHAHLDAGPTPDGEQNRWVFAGDWSETGESAAQMVLNRICLAEIGSGLALNEIGLPSERLPAFRCHDLPLEHWYSIHDLMGIEKSISNTQKRNLRFVLSMREKLWDHDSDVVKHNKREACELLWREPRRMGARKWEELPIEKRRMLVDACINGTAYLAQMIEKRFITGNPEE